METVVIVGTGLVGKSWAMLFAAGGHEVRLFDAFPQALAAAPKQIEDMFRDLASKGFLNTDKVSLEKQIELIKPYPTLKEALVGATYIQESTPETMEMKRAVHEELDKLLREVGNTTAIIGSSTSTLSPSVFQTGLSIESRAVVAHPVNPPYFVGLVEVIPNPKTNPSVTQRVRDLLTSIGKKPVVINKELPGFALNRLQYAILNECWNLVMEGVLSAEDVDTVMKDGLAPRYNFLGPLETAHLNADGFKDYCTRYGKGIVKVSETLAAIPAWTAESAEEIDRQLQQSVPNSELPQKRLWRDTKLAQLASFKKNVGL